MLFIVRKNALRTFLILYCSQDALDYKIIFFILLLISYLQFYLRSV